MPVRLSERLKMASPSLNTEVPGAILDRMPVDWTEDEVALAVEDYLSMLRDELRGAAYSKAEHRRRLITRLDGRRDGSVEYKHQNITAVLIELGLPYIDGYKPAVNYQRMMKDVVARYVEGHPDSLEELAAIADGVGAAPATPDHSSVLVDPPEFLPGQDEGDSFVVPEVVRRLDFPGRDARNRALGRMGEKFVLEFEAARLAKAGRKELARRIEWVSDSRGDGAGYDIASFDEDGRERLIEVKTTNFGRNFPFMVTRNELAVSRAVENYSVYRVFAFHRAPRLFMLPGVISTHCRLEPTVFRASFGSVA